ncbi:MAG TPA: hypothetical protein VFE25_01100 [Opitutaceae bacterium]|jgi:hypothetical protein|nr:hypothetical protein [Opitutaceae bacterium]
MSNPAMAMDHAPMRGFAPNHRWDRNFYLIMVGLAWLGILRGFGGEIVQRVAHNSAPYPIIVHFHAVIFVLWLVLFTVQVLLIRSKKVSVHKSLGFALVYLAVAMALIGPATALTVQHHGMASPDADPGFLSIQFTDILAFVGLTGAAIVLRKKAAAHKRLVLLGTLYITDAGYARWLAHRIIGALGGPTYWHFWLALYAGPVVLTAVVGIYDLATRKRLHPAYVAGAAYMFAVQMLAVSLYMSPAWPPVAKHLIAAWPWG